MRGRNAVALYDYTGKYFLPLVLACKARSKRELSFCRGQVLTHVIGPDLAKRLGIIVPRFAFYVFSHCRYWLEGELDGQKGLIPANFVEVLYTEENIKLVVEHKFIANNAQELSLTVCNLIFVINLQPKEEITLVSTCGDGWYRGRNQSGNVGLFPLTHVRVVPGQ
jgi:hypothetical protein